MEVFAADEIAIVHVINRTVRRCFLLRDVPVSGKNFDHRMVWLDEQLIHQARAPSGLNGDSGVCGVCGSESASSGSGGYD